MPVAQKDVFKAQEEEELKAQERAKNAGNGTPPLFLFMKNGQKVLIRPLVNYTSMLTLYMHSKYNKTNPKEGVNAVCADEVGQECLYCESAKNDRELTPATSFFLPVWLYSLKQQKVDEKGRVVKDEVGDPIWEEMTYEDKDGNKMRVSGLRVLELKQYGAIKTVMNFLRDMFRDNEYGHDITGRDLIVTRTGDGAKVVNYSTLPRAPRPMTDEVKGAIPTIEELRAKILEKCPPSGYVDASTPTPVAQGKSDAAEVDDDF